MTIRLSRPTARRLQVVGADDGASIFQAGQLTDSMLIVLEGYVEAREGGPEVGEDWQTLLSPRQRVRCNSRDEGLKVYPMTWREQGLGSPRLTPRAGRWSATARGVYVPWTTS